MGDILRRRGMMKKASGGGSRLPEGYTEVEYIESSGTQYIQTNIVPRDTKTECDFQFSVAAESTIVGKWDGSNQRYYAVQIDANKKFKFGNRSNTSKWTGGSDTNRHTIVFNDSSHGAYLDNSLKATDSTFACTGGSCGIGLFARTCYNEPTESYASGKIFHVKFTNNATDEVLGEFIPCVRDADSVAGMYDLVTNAFFGNNGTGSFTAGSPV